MTDDDTTQEVRHGEEEEEEEEEEAKDEAPVPEGFCVECRDQRVALYCEACAEEFCEVCFSMLHRTGNRQRHRTRNLLSDQELKSLHGRLGTKGILPTPNSNLSSSSSTTSSTATLKEDSEALEANEDQKPQASPVIISSGSSFGTWIAERSRYIPLRLNLRERRLLRLLEAALNVNEYTDKVDILHYGNKSQRMIAQIRDMCAVLSGLLVASDYKAGQDLIADNDFADNEEFFLTIFEIGRRHKVMNPEKMRSAYGKLMYLLQDSVIPEVQDALEMRCVQPLRTVHTFLEDRGALALLEDGHVMTATREITPEGKSRSVIQREIREKERAIELLARKYSKTANITPDEIRRCLYSIGDNHSFLRSNRDPCDRMIHYLTRHFNSSTPASPTRDLSIAYGKGGARLSHDHSSQWQYVHQTLSLWREIMHEMFHLWYQADEDLLDTRNPYRLRDTGQGLNRLQACPRVGRSIHRILHAAQKRCGSWIGSSVVHLGDRNVPNALMFIDKYNQVTRILGPLATCLTRLEAAEANSDAESSLRLFCQALVEAEWGEDSEEDPVTTVKLALLTDFFRYAFDGSGADNFYDAGSCIDGRLTSAWNWCSMVEKKVYYPVLLLTGFAGFDGGGFQ
ncbi:hypothetical protein BJ684DRAFT_12084 [Piptocephalis cylindrospora]|uniref:B box-type domain-containing protein n=1 Tax=Piptocephalis cylindrospora TaxID=1907219 RepID=A0A4P9Y2G9_9FUNG|nr:hypothetical protein BJ684DRAFT_12084 [Piptocephalis cylindrospora]|eukprot:RKP12040.1 hypothetical protein BJ684DRAFT_12084 [Piptocephalis cylindrospora]